MCTFTGLSVIIPTIDEREDIENVISVIINTCKAENLSEFIIIYSRASSDEYVEYLKKLPMIFPGTVFNIFMQKHPGLNAAIYEGYATAEGSHITAIGADGENIPTDISRMLEIVKHHPDTIVTCSRKLHKNNWKTYGLIKSFFNNVYQELFHLIFRTKQTDVTYLFQCTPSFVFQEYDFSLHIDNFIISLALLPEIYNIPLIEISTQVGKRQHGSSHASARYYWQYLIGTIKLIFNKPKAVIKK